MQSTNGAWSTITNIFTATALTPFSGVSVGDFAALMADGGTVAVYIARVTAVGGGGLTLTLSSTAISGAAPTTSATAITCTTGGAWKGPNAAVSFPIGFVAGTLSNSAGNPPRVNFKNNATYNITAAMSLNVNSTAVIWQGYTTAVGDGGKFIVDGGTSGASYVLLTFTNTTEQMVRDAIFQNNGASGSAGGVVMNSLEDTLWGVVVNSVRGHGISVTNSDNSLIECETYSCNQSNTALTFGVNINSTAYLRRCISHDNSGSNASGFGQGTGSFATCTYEKCISDTNGAHGFYFASRSAYHITQCDSYNNTGDGMQITTTSGPANAEIENCNLFKNGGYGINPASADLVYINNCTFGNGTGYANSSGQVSATNVKNQISGSITFTLNTFPWVDPANGDFRINASAAINAGRGTFTQTQASYAGTIGYPDIGAADHLESVSSGGNTILAGSGQGLVIS